MIINKVLGGGAGNIALPLFGAVAIGSFPTNFTPTGLNYTQNMWMFSGNDGGKICIGWYDSLNDQLKSVKTASSGVATGIAYTSTGYLIISDNSATQYPGLYTTTALDEITTSTTLTGLFSGGVLGYGKDIIADGEQCCIVGEAQSYGGYHVSYPGMNFYASTVPSFTLTVADAWSTNVPIRVCLKGSNLIAINGVGLMRWKSSVGAQFFGGNVQVASSISTSRVACYNGYIIVAGTKSDGTYIWYSNAALSESMTFTELRIDENVGTIVGISYLQGRYIVAYTYDSKLYFWASAKNDLTQSSFVAYQYPGLSSIATDTFVDMKSNGTEAYLLSYAGTNQAHATRLA